MISFLSVFILLFQFANAEPSSMIPIGADQCQPVKGLRSQFGNVRNQGNVGWCFAFASADLIGWALGIKPPDMVSARDIAVTAVTFGGPDFKNAGPGMAKRYSEIMKNFRGKEIASREGNLGFLATLLYINRHRLCLESQSPSEPMHRLALKEMLNATTEDKATLQWLRDQFANEDSRTEKAHEQTEASATVLNCNCALDKLLSADDEVKAQSRINDMSAAYFRMNQDKICPEDSRLLRLKGSGYVVGVDGDTQDSLLQKANGLLDQKQPFSIGFQPCRWKDPSKAKNGRFPEDCGHESIVVDRRWNNGSCEFLVRNSWGPNCLAYKKGVDCEDGNFWVSAQELFQTADTLFTLDKLSE